MPRAKPPVVMPTDPVPEGIQYAALRAEALHDMTHVLHAFFQVEDCVGEIQSLSEYLCEPENVDLQHVKQRAQSITGRMLKVQLWCDRQYWDRSFGKDKE